MMDTQMHTFHTEAQGHKVSVGASALWFLLLGCKMEMRLNGWHGLSLPAAWIIEGCSNTFDSTWWRLILVRCSSPLTFLQMNPPSSCCFSARFCTIWSRYSPLLYFLTSSSRRVLIVHLFFPPDFKFSLFFLISDPLCLGLLCFYPWRGLEFSPATGNLIRPIKAFSQAPYCAVLGNLPGVINAPRSGH